MLGARESNGVRVWRGIPYAAAPIGEARFRAPRPSVAWDGVRESVRFGPICPQPPLAGVAPREPMDEDCLYLNIWSPSDAQGLPVMVWIHGGGYLYSSGSAPMTRGLHLAKNGPVVVVTMNYRLGYRGFLDLSILDGAAGRFETNLGLRDQIAALRWVQDNIAAFGGDPNRVTIFGQSAGGASICCLLASPLARGLFGAAIAQSPPANSVFDRTRASTVTRRFLELLGNPYATFDDILNCDPIEMLEASAKVLDEMIAVFPGHHAFQPVIDNDVLLDTPIRSIAAGDGSSVALIVGSNQDEGSLFVGPPMPPLIPTRPDTIRRFVDQDHPGAIDAVLSSYEDHGTWGSGVAIGGDGMVTMPATAVAESMSGHAPVYLYRFRWSDERLRSLHLGTPHTLDVPFVFGTLDEFPLTDLAADDTATEVSISIQGAWLAFARGRKPLLSDGTWGRYTKADRNVMVIDRQLTIASDLDGDQRKAWGAW